MSMGIKVSLQSHPLENIKSYFYSELYKPFFGGTVFLIDLNILTAISKATFFSFV